MSEGFKLSRIKPETKRESADELKSRAEQFLEKIDFDRLRGIFAGECRKSGLDDKKINLQISIADVMHKTELPDALGSYYHKLNKIGLNLRGIDNIENGKRFENNLFSVVCHEETHSVATNPHEQSGIVPIFKFVMNQPIGQSGFRYGSLDRGNAFSMFNEAVTDTIAEEVYDEYLQQSGDRSFVSGSDSTPSYMKNYLNERDILNAFISALARSTEVPKDVIWAGVKQAYFSRVDLASSELVELYEEVLHTNVAEIIQNPTKTHGVSRNAIRQLKEIDPGVEHQLAADLTDSIENMSWTDALRNRATHALQRLLPPPKRRSI